ncbi:hypothetical protein [Candidatus Nitrotoga sp. 1052]|uniref:hypothetical protein n=1 Tax=Candidatus Nitrotoga sp. 1052 TaxID=2886964 RepID=UPI001EF5C30A|nr:hypothetical protein [Candidatus Nitrotoga sp. 1052]CAH1081237.1 conserved exported hypothetical protein [Candidatus Nitrotoga sp. 1052]
MRIIAIFPPLCALTVALLLSGCSTTPQVALDQANNGTHLMTAMQGEISKFRAEEAIIGKVRVNNVREAQKKIATMDSITADDDRIYAAAGKKAISEHFEQIISLVDARAKDEQALNDRIASINKTFDNFLIPLPDGTKDLAGAQNALAILGNELSSEDRLKIFANFAKDVKKSVDENKKKIEAAKNAAGISEN